MAHLLFGGAFLAWTVFVSVSDICFRRISNPLVLAGLIGGLAAAVFSANPFGTACTQALIGMLVGLVALLPFFLARAMGAADVKIFAVLGVWCGARALLWFWIVASVAAGIHAIVLMVLSRTSLGTLAGRAGPTLKLGGYRATPYAACLVMPSALWLVYQLATEVAQ
ncbi:prepilin peptidase [Burkholderia multivorans]|uniref:A24 family peptidase n=1 Tax=Burkholderia multivorans TaxID=87883 RepID=UPI000F4E8972|nr:prepilin peptidase [Burkholderia multivorans]AYY58831.1 prepilin peptidase [Burkholderia multivorans]MBU9230152.1 prepilin peptidase [Burkholderia multivorans]MBU9234352.1 prepilin peptidase [Burkholderia multivorans]MCA8439208.1 prepilin peptidase [Burkholderia multivorans]QGR92526.1 prepilin peptidase [Burkholderia multivorans]